MLGQSVTMKDGTVGRIWAIYGPDQTCLVRTAGGWVSRWTLLTDLT